MNTEHNECPTCKQDWVAPTDYECGCCGNQASEHISVTSLCRILRETQQREHALIVENKRLQEQLDEIGKLVKQMKFDSSYRISNWPFDLEPFESADHDNDSPTYQ
jgi:predicted amidophosphoribosyltransferase